MVVWWLCWYRPILMKSISQKPYPQFLTVHYFRKPPEPCASMYYVWPIAERLPTWVVRWHVLIDWTLAGLTFTVLLAICKGNSSITGEFPAQSPDSSTSPWQIHYSDIIMSTMASQIPGFPVLLNRLLGCRSKETSKLRYTGFVNGIPRWPVHSSHKGPVTRKMFPFDDFIM